jgi:DNA-binding CsgD family transcriptional regulator
MGSRPDYLRKKFGPLQAKTLQNAVAHRICKEFPRIGGPRIQQLCAGMILEVVRDHVRSTDHLTHGQVLWMAVSIHDPPRRHQRIADTDLVPVVLDLSTPEDVEQRLQRVLPSRRLLEKSLRLCRQAYDQGGLLSNCDLAELFHTHDAEIARLLADHERQTGTLVPRRATIHDVGTGLTHKRIICLKRYREGKPADQVARETYHSLEAVDRYLGQYDRVRHCRLQGLTAQETAYTLDCSLSLVREYLDIDRELENKDA